MSYLFFLRSVRSLRLFLVIGGQLVPTLRFFADGPSVLPGGLRFRVIKISLKAGFIGRLLRYSHENVMQLFNWLICHSALAMVPYCYKILGPRALWGQWYTVIYIAGFIPVVQASILNRYLVGSKLVISS